ncbi:hypothetical protein IQ259_07795 [Fortiea sp. LEGE XX443]|uniref:hypothetical protein n=1 Tax=Fortiea sp. LEGE XX443 TaxID=1828611 RepID=UPI00187ECBDC|nr:hypothetical protein [Fortiea sp. LEGE XX443]MBE9004939.1 hypothetical protein [Fortiea sp. LEGE XX443]
MTISLLEAIADEVMVYARQLDAGNAFQQGNTADKQDVIINAIAAYIVLRGSGRHANQHGKTVDVSERTWDELRKFAAMVEQ